MNQLSDQSIYGLLQASGVVRSKYDFSRLCGRSVGWFSSSRCQRRKVSVAALARLSLALEAQAMQANRASALKAQDLQLLARQIRQEMWRRSMHPPARGS